MQVKVQGCRCRGAGEGAGVQVQGQVQVQGCRCRGRGRGAGAGAGAGVQVQVQGCRGAGVQVQVQGCRGAMQKAPRGAGLSSRFNRGGALESLHHDQHDNQRKRANDLICPHGTPPAILGARGQSVQILTPWARRRVFGIGRTGQYRLPYLCESTITPRPVRTLSGIDKASPGSLARCRANMATRHSIYRHMPTCAPQP